MDPDDALYDKYVRLSPPPMPVSFFVDPSGVITSVHYGLIRLDEMEQALADALASTTPPQ